MSEQAVRAWALGGSGASSSPESAVNLRRAHLATVRACVESLDVCLLHLAVHGCTCQVVGPACKHQAPGQITQAVEGCTELRAYALHHLVQHLRALGRFEAVRAVLTHVGVLQLVLALDNNAGPSAPWISLCFPALYRTCAALPPCFKLLSAVLYRSLRLGLQLVFCSFYVVMHASPPTMCGLPSPALTCLQCGSRKPW